MSTYYFLANPDGTFICAAQDPGMSINLGSQQALLPWDTTMKPSAADVWDHPERYLFVTGVPVLQPYLELAIASDNAPQMAVYTATVTLTNPPAPAPTTLTVAMNGAAVTIPFAHGTATFRYQIHPAIQQGQVNLQVSASGCLPASTLICGVGQPAVAVQLLPSDPFLVAPTTKAQVRKWLFGFPPTPDPTLDTLTDLLHESYLVTSLLLHVVFAKLIPAASLSFTPDEANALSDLQTSLLPAVGQDLATMYPVNGKRTALYQHTLDRAGLQNYAINLYLQTLGQIPNLT